MVAGLSQPRHAVDRMAETCGWDLQPPVDTDKHGEGDAKRITARSAPELVHCAASNLIP